MTTRGVLLTRAAAAVRALLRDAADAVFDPRCAAGEHALGRALGPECAECAAALRAEGARPRCPSCSGPSEDEQPCAGCASGRVVRIVAPREHRGVARSLILALKAARREDAALPLARETFRDPAVRDALGSADVVVPVPAHPVRLRERGFNPAEALARELARLSSASRGSRLPLRDALRSRSTQGKQSSRSAAQRRLGLRDALRARAGARFAVGGRRVALVDDVVTTGATAAEAARLLLRAGAASVTVIAATRADGVVLDAPRMRRRSA